MSKVVKGLRRPVHFRAAIQLTLGCVLLGGCSTGSDRFSSASFGSGYEGLPAANAGAAAMARPAPDYRPTQTAQPVSSPAPARPASGYQLASATPGQQGGYLQVSRVDLPPLPQRQPAQGTKTADGYGPYNQPPITDGTYTGPRVYTPYDEPRGEVPPAQVYTPDNRPPEGADSPGYGPRPGYRDEPPYRGDRGPGYDRDSYNAPRPWRDRGDGERVRVEPGDTLYSLARRYGVTVDMIARANGLNSNSVRPGMIIYIPRADPAAYGSAAPNAPAAQTAACSGERCYVVKPGDTVASIARTHGATQRQITEANGLQNWRLKAGQTIIIPAGNVQPRQATASAQYRAATPAQGAMTPAPSTDESAVSGKPGLVPAPVPLQPAPADKPAVYTPVKEQSCEAALASPQPRMSDTFRKPVEGKTIAQFGPQKDGTVNEGVTISVPKGTPIKAAENGVVAYAGDELPGFGNLILIRHAGEYVTAYAHADTILVKKCDVVKRGQTVATAGTTGDASQPQLHFEIRKNSKPVDPMPLLGS